MQNSIPAKDKIIVALDVPTESEALDLVDRLSGAVGVFKIGLQLFTKCGPSIVTHVKQSGSKIFLDLKFHDIPNTVEKAVQSACALGVDMLTLHLSGGGKMIQAAARGSKESSTLLLGVTVLTSSNEETLKEVAIHSTVADQVLRLTKLGLDNGLHGFVASPKECALLRENFGASPILVTPGVRPVWAEANDQQRILTPSEAIKAGASYLVIGRPITAHENPREAAQKIAAELS